VATVALLVPDDVMIKPTLKKCYVGTLVLDLCADGFGSNQYEKYDCYYCSLS
jgi:hypothetical protein